MRKFDPVVRIVGAGPLPLENWEVLKELIKKAALRKLRQMQYKAQRKFIKKHLGRNDFRTNLN